MLLSFPRGQYNRSRSGGCLVFLANCVNKAPCFGDYVDLIQSQVWMDRLKCNKFIDYNCKLLCPGSESKEIGEIAWISITKPNTLLNYLHKEER